MHLYLELINWDGDQISSKRRWVQSVVEEGADKHPKVLYYSWKP